jgi:hypothetical protein
MTPDQIIEAEFAEVGPDAQPEGRALVATAPPPPRPKASGLPFSFRADASFVAQLIAAAANAPQTRSLRRASTDDALASYRGTVTREQTVVPAGTTTSRTV